MTRMYFVIGGGVWGSESKELMDMYGKFPETPEGRSRHRALNRQYPYHCIIGKSGYKGSYERWPKEGWFCKDNKDCLTMIIKPTPR